MQDFTGHDEDVDVVRNAISGLMDRFDTIQIFATRSSADDGGTINCTDGLGNWFARYGQVRAWMLRCDQNERNHQNET